MSDNSRLGERNEAQRVELVNWLECFKHWAELNKCTNFELSFIICYIEFRKESQLDSVGVSGDLRRYLSVNRISRSSLRKQARQATRNMFITSSWPCRGTLSDTAKITVAMPDSTKLNIIKAASVSRSELNIFFEKSKFMINYGRMIKLVGHN